MPPYTAPALADYPHELVRVACDKCGRSGQLRRDTLIAEHGRDITMPDLRHRIANCERRHSMADPCGIFYVDLANG